MSGNTNIRNAQNVKLVVSFVILNILALLSVLFRFWGIHIKRTTIKSHDFICVLSLITLIGYSITLAIGTVNGGIGQHVYDVSGSEMIVGLKSFFASQFLWGVSICAFRLAILLLYIEVFGCTVWFRRSAWFCVLLVCLFYIGALTITLRLCQPIAFNWDLTLNGSCGDEGVAQMAAAVINMVLDVVIVALPLPVVWGLQMRTSQKLGIMVTFALGLFIAGINLARIVLVRNCTVQSDFTYCTLDSAILTVAEMAVGIVVACVPRMGPVFRRGKETQSSMTTLRRPLRHNGYLSGRDHTTRKTQDNTSTDPIVSGDCESTGMPRTPHTGQDHFESSQHQVAANVRNGAEPNLAHTSGPGITHTYAGYEVDEHSAEQVEGIAVTQNFGVRY